MKTQTPTKKPPAKKAAASSKKSPGTQPISKTAASASATSTRDEENVRTASPTTARNDEIAALAYKIWQEQGCPDGREEQHWRQAEQAVVRGGTCAVSP